MRPVEIVKNRVYMISVDDLEKDRFESIWSIPEGISYNSYVFFGPEKVVVFDVVDARFSLEYMEILRELVSPDDVDYIVLQHLEPDHSGALPTLLMEAKKAKVVSSMRGLEMAKAYYKVEGGVEAKGSLDVGGGGTVKFLEAPWIHWPETFFSLWRNVLFTCDGFGSYGALRGKPFSNQHESSELLWRMKKYYANIVSGYSVFVRKVLEKLEALEFGIIAPSHGPVHLGEGWLKKVVEVYDSWSAFKPEPKLTIVYGSMYGHVAKLAEAVAKGALKVEGVKVLLTDVSKREMSDILGDLFDSSAIAFGMPTYEGDIFPPMKFLLELILHKRFPPRPIGLFGLYTWGGKVTEKARAMLEPKKFEVVEPVVNYRVGEGLKEAEELGESLAKAAKRPS